MKVEKIKEKYKATTLMCINLKKISIFRNCNFFKCKRINKKEIFLMILKNFLLLN